MPGPFSEQGKYAAAREPFREWCKENQVDFSTYSSMRTEKLVQKLWNTIVSSTHGDNPAATKEALTELHSVESTQNVAPE